MQLQKEVAAPLEIQQHILIAADLRSRMYCRQVCKNWQINIDGGFIDGKHTIGINNHIQIYLNVLRDPQKDQKKRISIVLMNALYHKEYDLIEALIQVQKSPIFYDTVQELIFCRYNPLDFAYRVGDQKMINLLQNYGYTSSFYKIDQEFSGEEEEENDDITDFFLTKKFPKDLLLRQIIVLPFLVDKKDRDKILYDFVHNNKSLIKSNNGGIQLIPEACDVIETSLLLAIAIDSPKGILLLKKYMDLCPSYDYLLDCYIKKACNAKSINVFKELLSYIPNINIIRKIRDIDGKMQKETWRDTILKYDCFANDLGYQEKITEILSQVSAKHHEQLVAEFTPAERERYDLEQKQKKIDELRYKTLQAEQANMELDEVDKILQQGIENPHYEWAVHTLARLRKQYSKNYFISNSVKIIDNIGKPWNVFMGARQKLSYFVVTSALLASFTFLAKHLFQRHA